MKRVDIIICCIPAMGITAMLLVYGALMFSHSPWKPVPVRCVPACADCDAWNGPGVDVSHYGHESSDP